MKTKFFPVKSLKPKYGYDESGASEAITYWRPLPGLSIGYRLSIPKGWNMWSFSWISCEGTNCQNRIYLSDQQWSASFKIGQASYFQLHTQGMVKLGLRRHKMYQWGEFSTQYYCARCVKNPRDPKDVEGMISFRMEAELEGLIHE